MAKSATNELGEIISRLQKERQEHADAVARIDALFERYGIQAAGRRKPGRPAGRAAAETAVGASRPGRRRRRRKFTNSGTESILSFLRQAGRSGATSKEISKHWKGEGRSGEPYITLGQLVKAKKLKKQGIEGGRGSRYTTA